MFPNLPCPVLRSSREHGEIGRSAGTGPGRWLLLAALALPLAAARTGAQLTPDLVTIARETAPGTGSYDLWTAPETGGPATLALAGVEFRPLRLAGATHRDRLRLDRPVEGGLGTSAPHVRLPGGGALYLVHTAGATSLLLLDFTGMPSLLATTPDVAGAPALRDTVAVSLDGAAALVATVPGAGGDALRVELAFPFGVTPLTGAAPALAIDADSLRLSAERAFFLAGDQLYRAVIGGADATPLPLGLPGSAPQAGLVLSDDGRSVALVARKTAVLADVLVVDPAGGVQRMTDASVDVDPAGLLAPTGPWLALAPDGGAVAWRQTLLGAKEVFLREVPQAPPPVQLTANAFFIDTLDNAGILGFAANRQLGFVAGEIKPAQIDAADVFLATLGAGGTVSIVNTTGTSGLSVPPFVLPGLLSISDAQADPAGERLILVNDPDVGDFSVLVAPIDGLSPFVEVLPALAVAPGFFRADSSVLVTSGSIFSAPGATDLHLLPPAGAQPPVTLLATAPPGVGLDRFTDGGHAAAFVASAGPNLQLPVAVDVAQAQLVLLMPLPVDVAEALAITPLGRVAAGLGIAGGPYLHVAFTGFAAGGVLKLPVGTSFPLAY